MLNSNSELIKNIKNKSPMYLDNTKRDESVLQAMFKVDRINFLPPSVKKFAYEDRPLSIGYNQTCSQPSMVAFMLDKLNIKPNNKILEIGAGCGYAAAVASELSKPNGIVYASEIILELADMMSTNLASYLQNINILAEDGSAGFSQYAPFDRIFISAGVSSTKFDEDILLSQLIDSGILLYPETFGNIYVVKKENNQLKRETYYGVSFVPLKGQNS